MTATPELRFPEFGLDWRSKLLAKPSDFSKGKGISKSDIHDGGATPCIRYGELYTEYGEIIDETVSCTNVDPINLRLSNGNEVLVPASGEVAWDIAVAACVMRPGIALGGDINILHTTDDGRFLAYYIGGKLKPNVARLAQGNSVVHVYGQQLSSLNVTIPEIEEQKKIADFLKAVDKKILLLRAKHDQLTRYKKGVMQKIFSQEIRFKTDDGSDFPDWKFKRFDEVFSFLRTNNLSRATLNYVSGNIFNIHYGDIHSKFQSRFKLSDEIVPYINTDDVPMKITEEEFCREGDLVIADASEDYADIGKTIEIVDLGGKRVLAGLHTYLARPDVEQAAKGFYGYVLQTFEAQLQIMKFAQGISVLGISKGNLGKINIPHPHPDEQQKIASFLSMLDEKVRAVSAQIDRMQTFKKGLLQQMFV
ncbi:restriction endonuclease subunit S [Litorimonas haliclonae]|uniref:restriction endonuclease subunit S n=1 Tax=Litorimonas haliclonae TaxID=2081977 RepID=UPI0039EEE9F1